MTSSVTKIYLTLLFLFLNTPLAFAKDELLRSADFIGKSVLSSLSISKNDKYELVKGEYVNKSGFDFFVLVNTEKFSKFDTSIENQVFIKKFFNQESATNDFLSMLEKDPYTETHFKEGVCRRVIKGRYVMLYLEINDFYYTLFGNISDIYPNIPAYYCGEIIQKNS